MYPAATNRRVDEQRNGRGGKDGRDCDGKSYYLRCPIEPWFEPGEQMDDTPGRSDAFFDNCGVGRVLTNATSPQSRAVSTRK